MRMLLSASLALLLGASLANGQNSAYRYVDERGVIHWAQSLQSVPPQYRSIAMTPDLGDTKIFPTPAPFSGPAAPTALAITFDYQPRLESLHGRYAKELQRHITAAWRTLGQQGAQPVVVFSIARDGRIAIPVVERSSGDLLYDLKAVETLMRLRPFPPLPREFPASQLLHVRLAFAFIK